MAASRHHILPALQGPPFEQVIRTWVDARERRDTNDASLMAAVTAFAVYARTEGITIGHVLRALNAVIDPRLGGDPSLAWDSVRERAGETAIASYFRAD